MMALKHPEILKDRGARTALSLAWQLPPKRWRCQRTYVLQQKRMLIFQKTGRFPLIGEGKSIKIMKLNFRKANKLIKKLGSMDLFADFWKKLLLLLS